MRGLVACHEPPAVDIGRQIFALGGNVADVAIATSYAQSVANPFDSSLSGKASIHVRLNAESVIIDAGHMTGSRADPEVFRKGYKGRMYGVGPFMIEGHANSVGYKAIMAPGFVPATQLLFERFGSGRLSWEQLIMPAARLASEGFAIYPKIAHQWDESTVILPEAKWNLRETLAAGNQAAMRLLLKPNGRGYRNGELFIQPDLGKTLVRIAREGPAVFYKGDIARQIADDFERNEAFVTYEDMAGYEVRVQEPIRIDYRGYEISGNPPPGNGIVALLMFNILEGFDLGSLGHNTPDYIETVSLCMRAAFVDRARYRGDPRLMEVPVERLLSKQHASEWRQRIRQKAVPEPSWGKEAASTTHLSVMDGDGNAVSMTHSHGGHAGAAVVTEGLGFLHNNHMKLFDPNPGSVDSIVPGKRQGGSVPLIVAKDGEPIMAVGGAGGTRQVTGTVQTIVNVIDHGMPVHQAVAASRFHSEHPSVIYIEPGVPESSSQELQSRGYNVQPAFDVLGRISAVYRDPKAKELEGGAEVRTDRGRGNVGYFEST